MNIFKKLFKREKAVACADEVDKPKGKRGRTLTSQALLAHESVSAVLTETGLTRKAILALVTDEQLRTYADNNWKNVIARLCREGKAKLTPDSPSRGRGVSYSRA